MSFREYPYVFSVLSLYSLLQFQVYIMEMLQSYRVEVIEVMNTDRFWVWHLIHSLKLNIEIISNIPECYGTEKLSLIKITSSFLDVRLYADVLRNEAHLPVINMVSTKFLPTFI